LFAVTVIG
jgi:hypothetical protein